MIPAEAVEAAGKAFLRESATRKGELGAQPLALLAALEAAAPHIRAQSLEAAADIAGRPENRWWAEGRNRAKWLRNLAEAERGTE